MGAILKREKIPSPAAAAVAAAAATVAAGAERSERLGRPRSAGHVPPAPWQVRAVRERAGGRTVVGRGGAGLTARSVAGAGGGGCPAGGNDFQWCFSQVKGAVDEDVAEGEARPTPEPQAQGHAQPPVRTRPPLPA